MGLRHGFRVLVLSALADCFSSLFKVPDVALKSSNLALESLNRACVLVYGRTRNFIAVDGVSLLAVAPVLAVIVRLKKALHLRVGVPCRQFF